MPYYQGDYQYMGDFYEGDPLFGGLFGRAARAIGGRIFRRKGPQVAIERAAPVVTGVTGKTMVAAASAAGMAAIAGRAGELARRAGAVVARHPVLSAAGAAGAIGVLTGAGAERLAVGPGAAPRGFHVSRRTGRVVRNRRMRVTNPRALRRAIRRCHGFTRLAMRVLSFTHPRRARGKPFFRRRKKR